MRIMGVSKTIFNDVRENELNEAEEAAKKRLFFRNRLIELTRKLRDDNSVLSKIEKSEPFTMFDSYVLAVGESPIWNIKRVLKKYTQDNTFNIKNTYKIFLETIIIRNEKLENS